MRSPVARFKWTTPFPLCKTSTTFRILKWNGREFKEATAYEADFKMTLTDTSLTLEVRFLFPFSLLSFDRDISLAVKLLFELNNKSCFF